MISHTPDYCTGNDTNAVATVNSVGLSRGLRESDINATAGIKGNALSDGFISVETADGIVDISIPGLFDRVSTVKEANAILGVIADRLNMLSYDVGPVTITPMSNIAGYVALNGLLDIVGDDIAAKESKDISVPAAPQAPELSNAPLDGVTNDESGILGGTGDSNTGSATPDPGNNNGGSALGSVGQGNGAGGVAVE